MSGNSTEEVARKEKGGKGFSRNGEVGSSSPKTRALSRIAEGEKYTSTGLVGRWVPAKKGKGKTRER